MTATAVQGHIAGLADTYGQVFPSCHLLFEDVSQECNFSATLKSEGSTTTMFSRFAKFGVREEAGGIQN